MDEKEFFSTGEVSQLLNISRATVSRKFDSGILYGKKNPITGERLICRESLLSFMRQYNIPMRDISKTDEKNILLASPNEQLQLLVKQAFSEDKRINIETVTSGYDALIMCSKKTPDLFIIDDDLTEISCEEAVKSIKRQDEQNNTKILCFLGNYPSDNISEVFTDNYIVKDNLEESELATKIAVLLDIAKESQPTEDNFHHNRQWPRIPVNIPAQMHVYRIGTPDVREPGDAKVENISFGGAFLSDIHMKSGSIPLDTFRFLLGIKQPPLSDWEAECKVLRLNADGTLTIGVQFVNLSQINKKKIADLII